MRRPTLLAPAAALAGLLLAPTAASAQRQQAARQEVEIPASGTELFRALLDRAGVKPVRQQDLWAPGRFDDLMVVVLGTGGGGRIDVPNPVAYARSVVEQGGAALVATDFPTTLAARSRLDARFGVQQSTAFVAWGRVRSENEDATLGGREFCPFAVPLTRTTHPNAPDPNTPVGQVFKDLPRVATNEPAPVRTTGFVGEFRFALAGFPRGSFQTDANGFGRERLPPDAVFAVGGYGPDEWIGQPYRYLGMGDHSVFINQMLIEHGTQNLELTYRVIEFLQSGGPAKRTRCVFIENGRAVERFDELRRAFAPPRPPLPIPDPTKFQQQLADFGNSFVDWLETSDTLNRLVVSGFGLPSIMKFFLIVLSIYAAWFLLRRAFAYRKPTDLPPPPAVAGVPTGPPGVFDRRQKELIRRNNLYEPVRDLVREFFASIGVHGDPGPKPPKLVVSDAVRRPESLRLAVRDFWRLAYGEPQEISASRWREMEPYFERLGQAHAAGKWRFVTDAEPVAAG